MLIVFGGLPGTGKTSIARILARRLAAVYLRIDTLEHAFVASKSDPPDIGPAGYLAGYALASDNLGIGMTVVADSVNALNVTRTAWRHVASDAAVQIFEVELVCSNAEMHRERVESRQTDIPDLQLPAWQDVLDRKYDRWDAEHLVIDTAKLLVEEAVERIIGLL